MGGGQRPFLTLASQNSNLISSVKVGPSEIIIGAEFVQKLSQHTWKNSCFFLFSLKKENGSLQNTCILSVISLQYNPDNRKNNQFNPIKVLTNIKKYTGQVKHEKGIHSYVSGLICNIAYQLPWIVQTVEHPTCRQQVAVSSPNLGIQII